MSLRRAPAVVPFVVAALCPAAVPAAPRATGPVTVVRVGSPILGFTQDGVRIAWLTEGEGRTCRILHVRSLAERRTQKAVQTGCESEVAFPSELALARAAAVWDVFLSGGNTEFAVALVTALVPKHRAHRVASVHGTRELGYPDSYPVVAGAGGLLAYSVPTGVRRIVDGRARRLFAFSRPLDLAVDGRRMAVVRQELRPGDGCNCITSPVWTPGGKVAFLSRLSAPTAPPDEEVTLIDADGSSRNVLTHDRLWRDGLDWSADGTRIAYSYAGAKIAESAPDGSGAHDVGTGDHPAWSPDGARIAFTRSDGMTTQVFVMDADGGNVRQLTSTPSPGSSDPSWSPDGTRIAYVEGPQGRISVMNADGSDQHQLGSLTGLDPDWSPDGRRLVFDRGFGPGEGISVAAADGTGAQPLTSGWDDDPHWSPDGRTIAFASARNDIVEDDNFPRFELYLVGSDGSNLHPLTYRVPASWTTPGEVHSAAGRTVASFEAPGATGGVALAGPRVAVLTRDLGGSGHLTLFSATSGRLLVTEAVPGAEPVMAGANARWVVYTTGPRTIRAVDLRTLKTRTLAVARRAPIGLSVSGRRVGWAENLAGRGQIVALSLAR